MSENPPYSPFFKGGNSFPFFSMGGKGGFETGLSKLMEGMIWR